MVARCHKGEDLAALMQRDLGDDVCRRAESIDADPRTPTPAISICAVTDQTGAQERGDVDVVVLGWKWKAERGVGNRVFGVPAIELIAGVARVRTEILATGPAEVTGAAGRPEPRNPDAWPGTSVVTWPPTASIRPTIS